MFSDHKSRGLNLESTRLTGPDRIERLLVAVTLAYLWIMERGRLKKTTPIQPVLPKTHRSLCGVKRGHNYCNS